MRGTSNQAGRLLEGFLGIVLGFEARDLVARIQDVGLARGVWLLSRQGRLGVHRDCGNSKHEDRHRSIERPPRRGRRLLQKDPPLIV